MGKEASPHALSYLSQLFVSFSAQQHFETLNERGYGRLYLLSREIFV
jgi:hypothetical protein